MKTKRSFVLFAAMPSRGQSPRQGAGPETRGRTRERRETVGSSLPRRASEACAAFGPARAVFGNAPIQGSPARDEGADAEAQASHPAGQARPHPQRRRAVLRARRLPSHHRAGHLQGGRHQPRRALRLLRQQGGADRRHLRARPRRLRRAPRRLGRCARLPSGAEGAGRALSSTSRPTRACMCLEIGLEFDAQPAGRRDPSRGR